MSFSLKISRLENYGIQRWQTGLWNRLMWRYEDGEVLFVHAGLEFNDEAYAGEGWILEFDTLFYQDFMMRYEEHYNRKLFADCIASPVFLPITDQLRKEMNDLARLLKETIELSKSALYLQSYADLILLNINRSYVSFLAVQNINA